MLDTISRRIEQIYTKVTDLNDAYRGTVGDPNIDLSSMQVIQSLNNIVKERDRYKEQYELKIEKMTESQKKMDSLRIDHEKRYEGFQKDVNARQDQIMQLMANNRELTNQLNQKIQALSEAEFKLSVVQTQAQT